VETKFQPPWVDEELIQAIKKIGEYNRKRINEKDQILKEEWSKKT